MGDFAAVYAKWVNDRDAIWGLTHVGPRNHLLDGVKVGESICCHGGGVTRRRFGLLSKFLDDLLLYVKLHRAYTSNNIATTSHFTAAMRVRS